MTNIENKNDITIFITKINGCPRENRRHIGNNNINLILLTSWYLNMRNRSKGRIPREKSNEIPPENCNETGL